jgi:ATP-binding cassette subfamily F protein 3
MVRLDRVQRRFGRQVLFDGLSWLIPPDARVGLVGPNGAGKTTLLRIVVGDDRPDAGSVHAPESLRIGYLPQEVETLGEGTVLEVALGGLGELREIESRLAGLEHRMSVLAQEDPALEETTATYGELRHRFEVLGGDRAEARTCSILTGLGVPPSAFDRSLDTLSGGWRMRVALARLLVGSPGLLLLDEPTNHLDLEALSWLEGFLGGYEGAFVVVSHDRYFLNRMVGTVAELDHGRLEIYRGNYDVYLKTKAQRDAAREKDARLRAREVARVQRFVERFRYKASKARQVQARVRALEKLEPVETVKRAPKKMRLGFPSPPRSGEIVVRIEGLSKSYGDNVVYRDLGFLMRRGDRVALVGPNGAGKSTLLKLLAGVTAPDGGRLELGHNVTAEYYAQHQLEALEPDHTVLQSVETAAQGRLDRQRARTLLGSFLFPGEDVDKKVAVLSGGEKARLALCRLLVRPANLLLLDEPTNHLDLMGREVLEDALDEYDGTLIFISHDRYFMNRVATTIGEVGHGRVGTYPGDYDTYLEHPSQAAPEPAVESTTDDRQRRRELRRAEAEERNRLYRERKVVQDDLDRVEVEIGALERSLEELNAQQADPATYGDPEKAARLARERTEIESGLERLYARWEDLARRLP